MKKVIYISAVVFGLSFVSCQKQQINPASEDVEIPTWDSGSENARGTSGATSKEGPENTGVILPDPGTSQGGGPNDDGEITDPNADPDAG